jgi:hypothetical protein
MIINQLALSPVGISVDIQVELRLLSHEISPLEPRLLLVITQMVDDEEILGARHVFALSQITYA